MIASDQGDNSVYYCLHNIDFGILRIKEIYSYSTSSGNQNPPSLRSSLPIFSNSTILPTPLNGAFQRRPADQIQVFSTVSYYTKCRRPWILLAYRRNPPKLHSNCRKIVVKSSSFSGGFPLIYRYQISSLSPRHRGECCCRRCDRHPRTAATANLTWQLSG